MKSIFIFVYGYIPAKKYGGPITSIYHFTEQFGDDYDIRIVCSNHELGEKKPLSGISEGWNKVGKASVFYLNEKEYSCFNFCKLMQPYSISMVHLFGVFSYRLNHSAILACRKMNITPVITLAGEICENVLKMKAYKKIPYLFVMRMMGEYKNVIFRITSEEERTQLNKYLQIEEKNIYLVPHLCFSKKRILQKEKIKGELNAVFISRIHPKKNLLDAIKAINKTKGKVVFDIFGPIEDSHYWEICKKEIDKAPSNIKICYKGQLDMVEAKNIYENYHVFVFPTLTENFGYVIAESLTSECPVIISRGTTPWDDLNQIAGYTVELNDVEELTNRINSITEQNQEEYDVLIQSLRNYISNKIDNDDSVKGIKSIISVCESNKLTNVKESK